jgi:hypothetical protein
LKYHKKKGSGLEVSHLVFHQNSRSSKTGCDNQTGRNGVRS